MLFIAVVGVVLLALVGLWGPKGYRYCQVWYWMRILHSDSPRSLDAHNKLIALGPTAAGPLIRMLHHEDAKPGLRSTAAWTLGKIDAPEVLDALEMACADKYSAVRLSAVKAVLNQRGQFGKPLPVDCIREIMLKDPSAEVRRFTVKEILEEQALSGDLRGSLEQATEDFDSVVRIWAHACLAALDGDNQAKSHMTDIAGYEKDPDNSVRRNAQEAIAALLRIRPSLLNPPPAPEGPK